MLGGKGSQTTSDNRHCPEFCSGRIDRIWSAGGLFADHPVFPIPILEVMLRARYGDLHGSLWRSFPFQIGEEEKNFACLRG